MFPAGYLTTVAEPGAAGVLPAPRGDGLGAAQTGPTAVQQSGAGRSSSTGAPV